MAFVIIFFWQNIELGLSSLIVSARINACVSTQQQTSIIPYIIYAYTKINCIEIKKTYDIIITYACESCSTGQTKNRD